MVWKNVDRANVPNRHGCRAETCAQRALPAFFEAILDRRCSEADATYQQFARRALGIHGFEMTAEACHAVVFPFLRRSHTRKVTFCVALA
jgi:hypothetical protein